MSTKTLLPLMVLGVVLSGCGLDSQRDRVSDSGMPDGGGGVGGAGNGGDGGGGSGGSCACDAPQVCDSSGDCTCPSGYVDLGGPSPCRDIDECTQALDNCDTNAICTNEPGTFTCECATGWIGSGRICADEDECANGTDDCGSALFATCTNTIGSYTCSAINVCATDNGGCDTSPYANCSNNSGAPPTCTCPFGSSGSGRGPNGCVDSDQCTDGTNNCDVNATCTDLQGGFTCDCNDGYTGNGVVCNDVNECLNNNGNCGDPNLWTCTNTAGDFYCTDIGGPCGTANGGCDTLPMAMCTNNGGNAVCSCPSGYTGSGIGTNGCIDIDECQTNNGGCDTNPMATCGNIDGSFTCTCPMGTVGSGVGTNGCVMTTCGDNILSSSEEVDPPPGPFVYAPVNALTCRYDFSNITALFCTGTCSLNGASDGCDQFEANVLCKLRTDNPNSTATAFTLGGCPAGPGFACSGNNNAGQYGTPVGSMTSRGVSNSIDFFDAYPSNHMAGGSSCVVAVTCTDP